MKDLIYQIIPWKLNIKKVSVVAYYFALDPKVINLEQLKDEFYEHCKNYPDRGILEVIQRNLLIFQNHKSSKEYSYYDEKRTLKVGCSFDIRFTQTIGGNEFLSGSISFEHDEHDIYKNLLKISGLKYLIQYNPYYHFWNTHLIQNYKFKGGLKILSSNYPLRTRTVDISERPGRVTWKGDFQFRGACDYWFCPRYFDAISKKTLQSYQNCEENEVLDDGTIHIRLFDTIAYWDEKCQKRIASFRAHLKIDEDEMII